MNNVLWVRKKNRPILMRNHLPQAALHPISIVWVVMLLL